MKLVEQELWQREEKGLIGVLPVHDSEAAGSLLSPGEIKAAAAAVFFFLIWFCEPFVGIVVWWFLTVIAVARK